MSSDNIPIYVQRVKSRIYMFPSVSYILYIYTPMFPLFNRKLTIVSAAVLSLKIKNTKIFYCLKKWDVSTFPECRAVLPGAAPAHHPPPARHPPTVSRILPSLYILHISSFAPCRTMSTQQSYFWYPLEKNRFQNLTRINILFKIYWYHDGICFFLPVPLAYSICVACQFNFFSTFSQLLR